MDNCTERKRPGNLQLSLWHNEFSSVGRSLKLWRIGVNRKRNFYTLKVIPKYFSFACRVLNQQRQTQSSQHHHHLPLSHLNYNSPDRWFNRGDICLCNLLCIWLPPPPGSAWNGDPLAHFPNRSSNGQLGHWIEGIYQLAVTSQVYICLVGNS